MQEVKIKESSLQHWISKCDRLIPKLEAMRADRNFKEGNTLHVLVRLYRDQGVINALSGHLSASKQAFLNAVDAYIELLDLFEGSEIQVRPGFVSHVFYLPLVCSVLAGDEARLKELFEKATTRLEEVEDPYFTNLYLSLAFLAVGNRKKAISHAKASLRAEKVWSEGMLKLIICIAMNDQEGFRAAWDRAIGDFLADVESELDDLPESALFLDGLALCKLNLLLNGVKFAPNIDQVALLPLIYGDVRS